MWVFLSMFSSSSSSTHYAAYSFGFCISRPFGSLTALNPLYLTPSFVHSVHSLPNLLEVERTVHRILRIEWSLSQVYVVFLSIND